MALLRLIHIRKLVPLADLLSGKSDSTELPGPTQSRNLSPRKNRKNLNERQSQKRRAGQPTEPKKDSLAAGSGEATAESENLGPVEAPSQTSEDRASRKLEEKSQVSRVGEVNVANEDLKSAVLSEIKREKKFFYGTVVAQAQRIEFQDDQLVFTFTTAQRALSRQLLQHQRWLEEISAHIVGRKVVVIVKDEEISTSPQKTSEVVTDSAVAPASKGGNDENDHLRVRAMGDSVVKALLDVFPSEIEEVEEM